MECLALTTIHQSIMKIIRTIVGALQTNCYILTNNDNRAIIIDPGAEPETIVEAIEKESVDIAAIILTHGHYDHIEAVPGLIARFKKIPVYASEDEIDLLANPMGNFSSYTGKPLSIEAESISQDIIDNLGFNLKLIKLPGHTPGGIGLVGADFFISGDTVFAGGGIGRTDLPGGTPQKLAESIEKVLQLPDELILHAGHGGRSIIGREKPLWREAVKMLESSVK